LVCYFFFFFSSRRRHTRSKRDWSSDVCSSDLSVVTERLGTNRVFKIETLLANPLQVHRVVAGDVDACRQVVLDVTRAHQPPRREIGRASCRERVESSVGDVATKKETRRTMGWQ